MKPQQTKKKYPHRFKKRTSKKQKSHTRRLVGGEDQERKQYCKQKHVEDCRTMEVSDNTTGEMFKCSVKINRFTGRPYCTYSNKSRSNDYYRRATKAANRQIDEDYKNEYLYQRNLRYLDNSAIAPRPPRILTKEEQEAKERWERNQENYYTIH